MKAVFIDSNTVFTGAVAEKVGLPEGDTTTLSEDVGVAEDVRALAEAIVKKYEDSISTQAYSELLFFINIDLVLNESYKPFLGVELLTWLRIKGIMSHCVMYSFCDASTIAGRDRQNLILFSQGTTFIQLPYGFSQLNSKIANLSTRVANNNNLESYLKASFNLGAFRHREANWWGMKQLADVHTLVSTTDNALKPDYPHKIEQELFVLNNAVASFLHCLEAVDLNDYLRKLDEEIEEEESEFQRLKSELLNSLHYEEKEIADITELKNFAEGEFKDYQIAEQYSKLGNIKSEKLKIQSEINSFDKEITIRTENQLAILRDMDDVESRIDRYENRRLNLVPEIQKTLLSSDIRPNKIDTNLILIDDEALNGWEYLYNQILEPKTITSLVPASDTNISEFYSQKVKGTLIDYIRRNESVLILLDLRLFDEVGRGTDKMSGLKLLDLIRTDFIGLPILIVSASNKRQTFEEVVKRGADAYWAKTGLDEFNDINRSIENYERLKFLTSKLAGTEYRTSRRLAEYSVKFRNSQVGHWTSKEITWSDCSKSNESATQKISATLEAASQVYRRYLHDSLLEYAPTVSVSDVFLLSALINKVCGIFELVHGKKPAAVHWEGFLSNRGDNFANKLREARNPFSHAKVVTLKKNQCEQVFMAAVKRVTEYLDRAEAPVNVQAKNVK